VSLLDTDHVWGVGGNPAWVWKSFLRGHNPLFMDPYDGSVLGKPSDPRWEPVRRALGEAHRFAERVNLSAMTPQSKLATTGYCLACPGVEYLVYQPQKAQGFSVDLKAGTYRYEWFNPTKGAAAGSGQIESSGGAKQFKVPFESDAVLYLKAQ
jgi:hypothetical protein